MNIARVILWYESTIAGLDSSEQLVLIHIILRLNRNFWKPFNTSLNSLAESCNKDKRTVKKALDSLISKGIVTNEGGYSIGYSTNSGESSRDDEQDRARVDTSRIEKHSDKCGSSLGAGSEQLSQKRRLFKRD